MATFSATPFGVPYEVKIPASWNIEFLLHPGASANKEAQQSMLNDIRRVAEQHKTDLAKVKEAIERDEKEQKENLVQSLKAVADLEVRKGTKGRRFQLVYWYDDEVQKTEGVEYPVERDEDGDPVGYAVLIDDDDHPFACKHRTMEGFGKFFTERNIPYYIAYFDE